MKPLMAYIFVIHEHFDRVTNLPEYICNRAVRVMSDLTNLDIHNHDEIEN